MFKRKPRSALAVAKKALRLAGQLAKSTQETKYLTYYTVGDLYNGGSSWGSAFLRELTSTSSTTPLFNANYLSGNKAFYKGVKCMWEIHMDNTNNEEETCNFTVAVVSPRQDTDTTFISPATIQNHISTIQGQTMFDPRMWKIHYYKYFTRTMGGTSPGTAGESTRYGRFYIPINKMIRFNTEGQTGAQTNAVPMSFQDRVYFMVFTDNSSADLENPRINFRSMLIAKDVDINH